MQVSKRNKTILGEWKDDFESKVPEGLLRKNLMNSIRQEGRMNGQYG